MTSLITVICRIIIIITFQFFNTIDHPAVDATAGGKSSSARLLVHQVSAGTLKPFWDVIAGNKKAPGNPEA